MPKVKSDKATKAVRHNPLADDVEEHEKTGIRKVPRSKPNRPAKGESQEAEGVLPAKVTQKVMDMAQEQKAEDDDRQAKATLGRLLAGDGAEALALDEDDCEQDEEIVDVEVDADGFVFGEGATEEEERALALFLPGASSKPQGLTLADVIMKKIEDHEARAAKGEAAAAAAAGAQEEGLSPKVIQVYTEIGKWLVHYKMGKLPKALKVVPSLINWEEVLSLTNPLSWSPAAMYEVVAIFASNLNPRMAQRFYNLVLLPALRQNIAKWQKLNFHYYRSVRKSLFKPAAFFKGIMLPWAQENMTLREAMILSSVLAKASIPPMHVAATVSRLAEMTPWYGTTSILLGTLINKKYALPLRSIESLISHFCAFGRDQSALPVVWHRALLLLVQRYKFEFNDDQRRRMRELLKVHFHEAMGPEVRRELLAPKPGEAPTKAMDMS